MAIRIRVTQKRSAIGRVRKQKLTLEALGIHKMHQTVIHNDTPQIRGMIAKIPHLLEVDMLEDNG
ncbi:MAG: 50S ribosomal protein L30 [Candidatus Latescibacteria bacterium]|jgi:large subunit ribosomal protein L30|nr:50S ribosomal protein L30 [Candidatus Latescibacterota bacterium]